MSKIYHDIYFQYIEDIQYIDGRYLTTARVQFLVAVVCRSISSFGSTKLGVTRVDPVISSMLMYSLCIHTDNT